MLKEGSLNDFQWLLNEEGFEPKDKDNNKKDDLEVQWGTQDIDPKYAEKQEQIVPTPVDRNNTSVIVQKARNYLNQGQMAAGVMKQLYDSYAKKDVDLAIPHLKPVLASEGILGCIAVDVTGYKDIQAALVDVSQSPYKRFVKYVLGYKKDVVNLPMGSKEILSSKIVNSSKNAVDSFLNAEEDKEPGTVAYCKELMMPIMAGYQDVDEHWKNDTLIDLATVGNITEDDVEAIRKSSLKPYQQLKCAFKLIEKRKHAEDKKYAERVDSKEHVVKASKLVVQVLKAVKKAELKISETPKMSTLEVGKMVVDPDIKEVSLPEVPVKVDKKANAELDVDPTNPSLFSDVNVIDNTVEPELDVNPVNPSLFSDINVNEDSTVEQLDVNAVNPDLFTEVDINDDSAMAPLDICESPVDNEIELSTPMCEIDIDPSTFMEEEFKDTDIIQIAKQKKEAKKLDVDNKGSFDF
jgi:hypothetical protein